MKKAKEEHAIEEKKGKRIPLLLKILIGVLVVALLAGGGFFGKIMFEQSKMDPIPTGKVVNEVYAIKDGSVNSYIVKKDDDYIMIDAGNSKGATEDALKELDISPDDISYILLTHSDSDHTASLDLFKKAEIYLPYDEVQMVDGTTKRNFISSNKLDTKYSTVFDGETLSLGGFSVDCILTSGHTPGSSSYIVDDKYMFVGDSLSIIDGKIKPFNDFFNMDTFAQRQSIDAIDSYVKYSGIDYIFTGHYGYTDDPKAAFE